MVESSPRNPLLVREYGTSGPWVVLVHGGPGAAGYMAPIARRLARSFRVLEPFQRGSGTEPLTVARHIADLHDVVERCGREAQPALVGHSWGAMLALAFAAEHPGRAGSLVLIGCGTFDERARARMHEIEEERMDGDRRLRLERLPQEYPDPDERKRARGNLILPLYSYDLVSSRIDVGHVDSRAHQETWDDMMRLQAAGVYPAAFATIEAPVIMLHGAADPHPGSMIRASLEPYIRRLEYREWERCGHYPWLERAVREEFFEVLTEWLQRHSG